MNGRDAAADAGRDLRRRAWRWHFIAAVLVIPFVVWQSVTGTLYLWSEHWADLRHPQLRFVDPDRAGGTVSLDAQVDSARALQAGRRIDSVIVPSDPARSTQVMFSDDAGLPLAVFVDPYRGLLLGRLGGADWPAGWSRLLHGGWPLGDACSWLLEIGACWTLVMVLTGLFLWWPRDGRGLRALLPRFGAGARIFWRDLHACVAVWFSLLIVLFLFTALPWTSVWGGRLLQPVQQALDQKAPRAAGFAPAFAGSGGDGASLQAMLEQARDEGLDGDLLFRMIDGPPGSAISVRDNHARAADERYLLLDRGNGEVLERADWRSFPVLAKAVATGVDIHEASYFGRVGPWINTGFALALLWLCFTGLMSWWRRKPTSSLGAPPAPQQPWPAWLRIGAVLAFLLLPLLAVSALLLWVVETVWSRWPLARKTAD
ncbi:MAG: PepSY domain-containing protein [Lysobacteraceae bacterium]